jgi:tetratricopeptide (TPR) repeat protein
MRKSVSLLFASLASWLLVGAVNRVAESPWVGKKVLTTFGAVLRPGGAAAGDPTQERKTQENDRNTMRFYRVEQSNGPWLWVVSTSDGAQQGWVKVSEVVGLDQAINEYSLQVRLHPDVKGNYVCRGAVFFEKGEYDFAIADYGQAIRIDPNDASSYISRGAARQQKREFDQAIADYSTAIRLDPKNAAALTKRGNAWYSKMQDDQAFADYSEAIRLDPSEAPAYFGRGNLYYIRNDYARAIADYNEAIRLMPRNAAAYHHRGDAWKGSRNYERALADYAEAVRLDPNYAKGHASRAWLLATCPEDRYRDGRQAVDAATRAHSLDGGRNALTLAALAAAYAETGDFDRAARWQQQAVDLAQGDAARKQELARLDLYRSKRPYREPAAGT